MLTLQLPGFEGESGTMHKEVAPLSFQTERATWGLWVGHSPVVGGGLELLLCAQMAS